MQRAKLRVIATNIMLCEKEIRQGKNVKENENKDFIVLQGAVDCAFLENDKYVLVDYKTDRISDISELFYKYNKQVELYKYALKISENIDVKETILYSFSLGDSYSF